MAPRQKLDASTQNAAQRRLGTSLDPKIRRRSTEAISTMERMGFDPMVAAIHTFRKLDQEIFEMQQLKHPDGQILNKDGSMRRFSVRALTELYGQQIKICTELLKYRYAKVPEITGSDQKDLPPMVVKLTGGVRAGVHTINGGNNAGALGGATAPQAVQQGVPQEVAASGDSAGVDRGYVSLGPGHADVTLVSDDEIRAYARDRVASEALRSVAQDRLRQLEERLVEDLSSDRQDGRVGVEVEQGRPGSSELPELLYAEPESRYVTDLPDPDQDGRGRVQPQARYAASGLQPAGRPAGLGQPVQDPGGRETTQDQAGASAQGQSVNPKKLKVPTFGYPNSTGPSILKPPVRLS